MVIKTAPKAPTPKKRKPPAKPKKPNKHKGGPNPALMPRDSETGRIKKLDISQTEAFEAFCKMEPEIPVSTYVKKMQANGIQISLATAQQWCAKHQWIQRKKDRIRGNDPKLAKKGLANLETISEGATPESILGLIGKLVHTINHAFDDVAVTSPDDIVVMVEVLEKLISVKTLFRGSMIPVETTIQTPEKTGKNSADDNEKPRAPSIGEFTKNIVEGGKVR
ncbi:MAG: hypothetical protein GY938_24515 [Ketobacter sp.]|nr:hypothetical protein [Ketobacter sp.]